MNLIPFVETAMGLLNFKAVCEETLKTGPQVGLCLDAVVFGGEDFRASIGATSNKDTQDILYARQKVVVTAKAFGLQAIDLVYIDFRDEDGLLRQSREAAAMGFTGKQVIHPNQIAVVQEQFTPTPEKIQWAEELIAAFKEHQQLGKDDGLFAQIFSLPWSNTFTMSGKKEAFATNLHFLKNGNHRPEHTILLQNPTQDFK
eukprot:XP_011243477.1 PREDICTED: citrate lyase subunit beta-like protein, mitochondrial isoform X4 [Mus musculus]